MENKEKLKSAIQSINQHRDKLLNDIGYSYVTLILKNAGKSLPELKENTDEYFKITARYEELTKEYQKYQ